MSKAKIYLVFFVLFLFSCKDKETNPEIITYHDYIGWIFITDSIGQFSGNNNSNVRVTLLETGSTKLTDSNGHYTFQHLQAGTYNFKYEYQNYPIYYFQDVVLSGENGSVIYSNGSDISPKSIWTITLDSTNYSTGWYSTGKSTTDTSINIYFTRTSPKLTPSTNWLWIMSKSVNSLDYYKGQYILIEGWTSTSTTPSISASVSFFIMYDSLRAKGFLQGDSVCIKLYSLNSVSFYVDKVTQKRVYPSIGKESNVISTVLK